MRRWWLWVWALAGLSSCSRRVPLGEPGMRTFSFRMRDFRLPSGLRIVIEEDHAAPVVGVAAIVGAGATAEPPGKPGLARLAAELTLRARPAGRAAMRELLERAGAARLSARVAFDHTVFSEFAPRGSLGDLLRLESSRILRPLIDLDQDAFQLGRAALRAELERTRESDEIDAGLPHLLAALFPPGHPYARAPSGTAESVSGLELGDVTRFVKLHYRADNVTLMIIGDVDLARVGDVLRAALPRELVGDGKAPPPSPARLPPTAPEPPDPPPAPPGDARIEEAAVATPEIWIGWTLPGDFRSDGVVETVLAEVLRARLGEPGLERAQAARKADALVGATRGLYDLRSLERPIGPVVGPLGQNPFFGALGGPDPTLTALGGPSEDDPDVAELQVQVLPGVRASLLLCRVRLREGAHPGRSVARVLEEARRIWFRPPQTRLDLGAPGARKSGGQITVTPGRSTWQSSDIADRASQALVGRTAIQTASTLALDAEELEKRALLTAGAVHFASDPRIYSESMSALRELTAGQLEGVAARYLARERARILYLVPRTRPVRPAPVASGPPPAAASAATPPGWAYDPALVPAIARPPGLGAFRTIRLENGLEVVMGRRGGIPMVTVGLALLGGRGAADPPGVAELAAEVARPGSHVHGELAFFGARDRLVVDLDRTTIEMQGGAGNLDKLLAILADRVGSMSVPAGALDDFRRHVVPALRKKEQAPGALLDRGFLAAVHGEHAYGQRPRADTLAAIGAGALERWLRQTYSPRNAVLAIVGDVDPARAEAEVRRWLGGWRGGPPVGPPRQGEVSVTFEDRTELRTPEHRPAGPQVVVTGRPGSGQARVELGCALSAPAGDAEAPVAVDLLAAFLTAHLETSWRDQLGLGADLHGQARLLRAGRAQLEVGGEVDAARLGEALRALREFWDGLGVGVIDEAELDRARWLLARRYSVRYSTTRALVEGVLEARTLGRPLAEVDAVPERLARVTREKIQEAARACQTREVLAISGDEPAVRAAVAEAWR